MPLNEQVAIVYYVNATKTGSKVGLEFPSSRKKVIHFLDDSGEEYSIGDEFIITATRKPVMDAPN